MSDATASAGAAAERDFRQTAATALRFLKIAHELDPTIIPFRLFATVVKVGALYGGLALTALLVDALLARELRAALVSAAALALMALANAVVAAVAEHRSRVDYWTLHLGIHKKNREKAMGLPFALMEDAERVQALFGHAERNMQYLGGLLDLVGFCQSMLEQVLSLGTCLALVVALCASAPAMSGPLALLASPVGSFVVLVCALAALLMGQAAVTRAAHRAESKATTAQQDFESRLGYFIHLVLQDEGAAKVMRLYGMARMVLGEIGRFDGLMFDFYDALFAARRNSVARSTLVNGAFVAVAYVLVGAKVLTGAITIGAFTQYAGALAQLGGAWSTLVREAARVSRRCADMQGMLDFLDLEDGGERGSIPPEKRDDGAYELAFEHVDFAYPGSDQLILKDVSVRLGTGHKIAVVGPNGAGKSTFIKLLCRLYEPTGGRITLNGIDIGKYDEGEYRDLLGVVFQDFRLFAFPVGENVAVGRNADEARLWECLEQAGAADFVRGLPAGLSTQLYNVDWGHGKGITPSGGEAQKLALARALYKDAPVVILDEPTAALDPIAEAEVYARFDQMVEGKTAIYISHRMSSCRFCDDILVFDGGRIVEGGTHEELLAAGGLYAKLWESQAQYYV